jgi:AcrR family transcriptional regulator
MSKINTKEKILAVAGELFASNGYDNTSIRDISSAADVNLASINYHFTNKSNLYREVMETNIQHLEEYISKIASGSKSTKEFTKKLFDFFTNESTTFINSFKIFITNTPTVSEEMVPQTCRERLGPPGSEKMKLIIKNEVGSDIPEAGIDWAVRVIFDHVAHSALVLSSCLVRMLEDQHDFLSKEGKYQSIDMVVEAILNFLKENPDKFS